MAHHQQPGNAAPALPDLFAIERESAGDFPFYNGRPVSLSGVQWLALLIGTAAGFALLIAPIGILRTLAGGVLPVLLFFGIPLATLAMVAGSAWTSLFRKPVMSDLLWMVGIAVANLIVSVAVVLAIRSIFEMNANPVGGIIGDSSAGGLVLFYARTIPQLFGEEVVSVLPFLAILWFCHSKLAMTRKSAIVVAWLGAALIFGALHLPTYGWNFVQCFLVIGTARIVLLVGYIVTKNIWVSTGAHIINDWLIFTVMALAISPDAGTA